MTTTPLYVTQTFLPPQAEVFARLENAWATGVITNNGPLLQELETALADYLKVPHAICMTNGTLVLEEALDVLGLHGAEVITTPFSFAATLTSLMRKGCTPVFADIDPDTFCIDPAAIERALTPNTKAIMAVHVFGNLCDVAAIDAIAQKHGLAVIYDAAHSFASFDADKSVFNYGDIATCSFHATKIFHTVEGGACFTKRADLAAALQSRRNFGFVNAMPHGVGTNAKMSEMHAAVGLCNLDHLPQILKTRAFITAYYDVRLPQLPKPLYRNMAVKNYAYYPVLLKSEAQLLHVVEKLQEAQIFPRRYFYPALNTVPFLERYQPCPIAEDIAARILCLPLSAAMTEGDVTRVCAVLVPALS